MTFIDEISKDKQAVTLYKYNGNDIKVDPNLIIEKIDKKSDLIRICFIDLETTGTHKKNDFIIEIALKVIEINKHTGEQLKAIDAYESFQDPGVPIPEEASLINGITDDMVKDGVIILDVGINRIDDTSQKGYYIVGDVDFDNVVNKASVITPVPGGIGPMTIAMLLYNTVKSAENKFI